MNYVLNSLCGNIMEKILIFLVRNNTFNIPLPKPKKPCILFKGMHHIEQKQLLDVCYLLRCGFK